MPLYKPLPGALACDTSGDFSSAAHVAELAASGYRAAIRYVTCPGGMAVKPLSPTEAAQLLAAGVAIGLIQAIQTPANISPATGTRDGASAAAQAQALGYPAGATLWCDMEGVYHSAPDLISYLNNWCKAVQAVGFSPGLYNGPQPTLTGPQIQSLIFPHYWKAAANVPTPARGYQLLQMSPPNLAAAGTAVDLDVVQRDNFGDLPVFWGP